MEALNINRLSKLYHLRPSQRERQRLLDASLHQAFEEDLDAALANVGIEDYGDICVRLVHVPLNFNFGHSQSETSQHWSTIIARQIREEIDKGGNNIIRYRSRLHALMAFADDMSQNKLQNSWAWNQIGLSNLPSDASLSQARSQLVTALLREPAAILTVFKRLAEKQRLLSSLLEWSTEDRTMLVDGLISEMGIERRWLDASPKPELVVKTDTEQSVALSEHSLSRSSLLAHLLSNAGQAASLPMTPRIWVILILHELEPLLFRRATEVISQAIAVAEKRLLPVLAPGFERSQRKAVETEEQRSTHDTTRPHNIDTLTDGQTQTTTGRDLANDSFVELDDGATVNLTYSTSTGKAEQAEAESFSPHENDYLQPGKTSQNDTTEIDRAQIDETQSRENIEQTQGESQVQTGEVEKAGEVARSVEAMANPEFIVSEFAGLFLLLPVLAEISDDADASLIDQIAADSAFSARPLSWVLYRLTTHWLAIPAVDLALREFCAINIDADWPWPSGDEATRLEARTLESYCAEIESRVLARYHPEGLDQLSVVEILCRRSAQLLIDNGWLELVFELNEVDTNIRRAGLDLDPGFVPWLGKVVKIRYE